jgi:hypothetical protein
MAAKFATLSTTMPGYSYEKEPSVAVIETTQDVPQNVAEINKDVSEEDWVYPYPTSFVLADKCQVAVIGAGLAGITAGALLPAKVPGIQLTIFEKNPEVVCQRPRASLRASSRACGPYGESV